MMCSFVLEYKISELSKLIEIKIINIISIMSKVGTF